MKPVFEKIIYNNSSLYAEYCSENYFDAPFHFHPEIELMLVTEGHGKIFVGDAIMEFSPGYMFLLGPNLPHFLQSDHEYYDDPDLISEVFFFQFKYEAFGKDFFENPELFEIDLLLKKAAKGILFNDRESCLTEYKRSFDAILNASSHQRFILLMDILGRLSREENIQLVSNSAQWHFLNRDDTEKIQIVFDYIHTNLDKELKLPDIASLINMSDSSFCRFFKSKTKKTVFECIIEFRLTKAKKLLRETSLSIVEICFESGFNNLSNFNRIFKKREEMTPLKYRKAMQRMH